MSTQETDASFRPPNNFIKVCDKLNCLIMHSNLQASLARQALIKQKYETGDGMAIDSPIEPPPTPSLNYSESRLKSLPVPQKFYAASQEEEAVPSNEPGIRSSSVRTSPSKTAIEVDRLRKAREERRSEQNEARRVKESLNSGEQDVLDYQAMIQQFLKSFPHQSSFRSANSERDHRISNDSDSTISVCVRKKPFRSSCTIARPHSLYRPS